MKTKTLKELQCIIDGEFRVAGKSFKNGVESYNDGEDYPPRQWHENVCSTMYRLGYVMAREYDE